MNKKIKRFPPSKKVLDERKPPAPWILLTENPEPSPALKEAVSETTPCAFGFNDCPCLEPDIDHVFIHMQRMQIECHACGAKEDISLLVKLAVIQTTIDKHKKCERKRGHNE